MKLNVIFEDNDIIVIEKPAGVPSQGDKTGDHDILSIVSEYIGHEAWLIHRLDRPVGGLMILAKNSLSAMKLSEAVKNKCVNKIYRAVCCGKVNDSGILCDYLMKNQRLNISKVVNKGNVGAKIAELEYHKIDEVDSEYGVLSLLEINLVTGRHHQIRVQMMNMGAPLWGDVKYNERFKHKRNVHVALFSYRLEIKHPVSGEIMQWKLEPSGEIFKLFEC